jgi:hypothetical protein
MTPYQGQSTTHILIIITPIDSYQTLAILTPRQPRRIPSRFRLFVYATLYIGTTRHLHLPLITRLRFSNATMLKPHTYLFASIAATLN